MSDRVAVFVDGDNLSAKYADSIREASDRLGRVDIVRVYAAAANNSPWGKMPGYQLIHSGSGKNTTDILLSIDAVAFGLQQKFQYMVIASSDRDFTHLATRLRLEGIQVVGIGERKTPPEFRATCTTFEYLDEPTPQEPRTDFDEKIKDIIAANSKNGAGMPIYALNAAIKKQHDTLISQTQEKNWRAYLSKRPALYELDPKGPEAMVRLVKAAFTS